MTKREIERSVQPSLLDRLTDHDPRNNLEGRIGYLESVRQFKTGLQRDLEWLLNTRRIPIAAPDELEELGRSTYHYGLPDVTSISRDSHEARQRALRGKEFVRRHFLTPRLLRDWLVLFNQLLGNDTSGAEVAVVSSTA